MKLVDEEKARQEAEEVAGEKLVEIDELQCASQHPARAAPHRAPHRRSENAALAAKVVDAEAETAAAETVAEEFAGEAAASASAAASAASAAAAATLALATVASSILRWRDSLVVASLESHNYGEEPSAAQVLEVVADMDNEVSVNVLLADQLPPELKAKLAAKRAEQARRRLEAPGSLSTFQPRAALDAPERLARLVAASAAAAAAPAGAHEERAAAHASATASASSATSPGEEKENAPARGRRASQAAPPAPARPFNDVLLNAMHLARRAQLPRAAASAPRSKPRAAAAASPPRAPPSPPGSPSGLLPRAACAAPLSLCIGELSPRAAAGGREEAAATTMLPGEMPGGPSVLGPLPSLKVKGPKLGAKGKGVDRRSSLAALASSYPQLEKEDSKGRLALRL